MVFCFDYMLMFLDELFIDCICGLGVKFGREFADGLNVKIIGEFVRMLLCKFEEVCGEEKV